jgi:glycosyltransferase involved in cell wall biosynthesis
MSFDSRDNGRPSSQNDLQLDVIIPTYNREDLLPLTLESLLAAPIPMGLKVIITVVDNNSKDGTKQLVQHYHEKYGERIRYVFETKQGRSHALNAGITSTTGDLLGMIDDDEKIDSGWYQTVFDAFRSKQLDFIGGPYVPEWLPSQYGGVVGWVDGGDKEMPFDSNYPGILMGGNAVLKRSILEKIGLYTTWLGRTDKRLLSGEDEDLYHRLLAAGAKGMYLPNLIIYHHVPPERLTKKYFRSWCFWRGVSLGLLDRKRKLPCAYLLGIPRWRYRKAAQGAISTISQVFVKPKDPAKAFASELGVWDWIGLFYGRHFHNTSLFQR